MSEAGAIGSGAYTRAADKGVAGAGTYMDAAGAIRAVAYTSEPGRGAAGAGVEACTSAVEAARASG